MPRHQRPGAPRLHASTLPPTATGRPRRVMGRLLLVTGLAAAVALVLVNKPTRDAATNTTAPASTAPATSVPPSTALAVTSPSVPADAPTAPAAVAPSASHAREKRPVRLPRLVDLGADRCIPCKAMVPILVELRREYAGRMQVDFIDVWKDPSAGDPYDIYSIPTQIFFDEHGRELTRHQGFLSKEDILATWRRVGYDFSAPGPASPAS